MKKRQSPHNKPMITLSSKRTNNPMWRPSFLLILWLFSTGDAFSMTTCPWKGNLERSNWDKRRYHHHGRVVIVFPSRCDCTTRAEIAICSAAASASDGDSNESLSEFVNSDSRNDSTFLDIPAKTSSSNSSPEKPLDTTSSTTTSTNDNNSINNANASSRPYLQVAQDEVVGIGGKRGYTYDVNKLKLNLVQKSVRQFKQELLSLLISSSSSTKGYRSVQQRLKIEEKLAALISANPVATTTDSNLLEGTWELAFVTDNAMEILDEARFVYSRKKQGSTPGTEEREILKKNGGDIDRNSWKLATASQGKLENPLHSVKRSIYLENLDQDEDPFMVDCVSLFRGLWTVKRYYKIVGLTRTNLQLIPSNKKISFCGREISGTTVVKVEDSFTINLQFIYLDSDICISMTAGNADNIQVYTKNEEWIESRRQKKHIMKTTLAWINKFGTPLKLRRRIFSILGHEGSELEDYSVGNRRDITEGQLGKLSEEEYQILLRIVYDDKVSKLTALRLGDYGDGSKDDESAWGGKDDPFVHLTADERQSIMKQMSIGEIKKAGYIQRKFAEKNKRRRSSIQKFKRPLYEEGQG